MQTLDEVDGEALQSLSESLREGRLTIQQPRHTVWARLSARHELADHLEAERRRAVLRVRRGTLGQSD